MVQGLEGWDDNNQTSGDGCRGSTNFDGTVATAAQRFQVEPLYTCTNVSANTPDSSCRRNTQFVRVQSFNVQSINSEALHYDTSTRSLVGYKPTNQQLKPIELCLDRTILNPNTDLTLTARSKPVSTPTGATYDPFSGTWRFIDSGGTLTQITPAQAGADKTPYQETLNLSGNTATGVTVGEEGRLYVSTDPSTNLGGGCKAGAFYVFARDTSGNTTFATTAVGTFTMGASTLGDLFTLPGESPVGIFTDACGSYDVNAADPTFSFFSAAGSMVAQEKLPDPSGMFVNGTAFTKDGDAMETAPDGGAFVVCVAGSSEAYQLFARTCQRDLDCAAVMAGGECDPLQRCNGGSNPGASCTSNTQCLGGGTCGTVTLCVGGSNAGAECTSSATCSGGGTCTNALGYCHAPGRARDDRATISVNSSSNTIAVLSNDVRSESSCRAPAFYIVSASISAAQGTVTLADTNADGRNDVVRYTPPARFCGGLKTFTYTAALGGSETGTATVTVFIKCVCGDGNLQAGEQCDDGNAIDGDRCGNDCLINVVCGDGVLDPGEECNDHNAVSNDGCSSTCRLETVCGNNITEGVEECDGTAPEGKVCNANCRINICGDGVLVVSGGEDCDDGALNSDTGANACRKTCTEADCGDGVKDTGEQCDDGNTSNLDACSTLCLSQICGNGVREGAEQCDDLNVLAGDGCSPLCRSEAVCGNGVRDGSEGCDDHNTSNGDGCRSNRTQELCGDGITDAPLESCDYADPSLSPTLVCSATCRVVPVCGNGVIEAPAESCDAGASNSEAPNASCRTDCERAGCGDGVVDTGEQCDDGNALSGDGCGTCVLEPTVCGDGKLEGSEECDDHNVASGDGCRANCTVEVCGDGMKDAPREARDYADPALPAGTLCSFTCRLQSACGNGVVESGELCDLGNGNSQLPNATCRADCSLARCGDGVVDSSEGCDDGNLWNGDGCSSVCSVEGAVCGNNLIEGLEECDDGGTTGGDGCRANCTVEACGDGLTDLPTETCDDGNTKSGDGCSGACRSETVCGNGIREAAEQCDDGNNTTGTCDGCSPTCRTVSVCGNGVVELGESCDDGRQASCSAPVSGDGCDTSCQVENYCGDSIIAGLEECAMTGTP